VSRTILITGATGKIGKVLVRHFLNNGDRVVAAGRSDESLNALVNAHAHDADRLFTIRADLTAADAVATVMTELLRVGCMPDCLINNARNVDFLKVGEGGMVARQDFMSEFGLDVVTPYELIMELANCPDSRLQAVVNIGSQYGSVAPNLRLYSDFERQSPLQYGVAKAALAHLSKELAVRLAGRGIRVNCVAFGGVEGRVDEAFKQRYASLCPMGRMLNENELAGPVDLLLSNAASAVTGHVMMVDGGWSVW
jgi:hypothetical protein